LLFRGRGVTGARGGRIAEMRVRFPSSPVFVRRLAVGSRAKEGGLDFHFLFSHQPKCDFFRIFVIIGKMVNWEDRQMRTIVPVLILLSLYGCQPASRQDPYLEAISRYNISLDVAKTSGQKVSPPPKPVYLECPVQPEPLPEGSETTGESAYRTRKLPEISVMSQSECEKTNTERKQAYEDALKLYHQLPADQQSDNK
jgi:hypothetical protein